MRFAVNSYVVYLPGCYVGFKQLFSLRLLKSIALDYLQVLQRHLDTNCEMMKRITSPGADSTNQISSLTTTTDNQHSNHSIAQVLLFYVGSQEWSNGCGVPFILARSLRNGNKNTKCQLCVWMPHCSLKIPLCLGPDLSTMSYARALERITLCIGRQGYCQM